jgi:hypothetical protein
LVGGGRMAPPAPASRWSSASTIGAGGGLVSGGGVDKTRSRDELDLVKQLKTRQRTAGLPPAVHPLVSE